MNSDVNLTELIHRAQQGDSAAADALFTATYQQLRRLARARLRVSGRDAVLDTTALVHESYLRLAEGQRLQLNDRLHFLRYAGRAMRSVIVDFARRQQADRRGGGALHVSANPDIPDLTAAGEEQIMRVDEALKQLAQLDQRLAQVVEMRYFAGMTESEIAQALGVTERTVRRDWEKARLLLAQALT
jgi:RNA polymerase sigma factor (TIGR02999 family)